MGAEFTGKPKSLQTTYVVGLCKPHDLGMVRDANNDRVQPLWMFRVAWFGSLSKPESYTHVAERPRTQPIRCLLHL